MKSTRRPQQRLTIGTLASCKVFAYMPHRRATLNSQQAMGLEKDLSMPEKELGKNFQDLARKKTT